MTVWRMLIEYWIPKATNTHNYKCVVLYLLYLHCNNGSINAPQCFLIRTLPVFICNWFMFLKKIISNTGQKL
jgi:hypothetical protein